MRSGPKAISYQSTLFRLSELAWIKVAPLPPWRLALRWSLILSGVAFFFVVASAKDSYFNLEGLLGLLAWHVGYHLSPQVRLGSCGDLEESYENRGGGGSAKTFGQWVAALGDNARECKVSGTHSKYWFNLERIAWAGPCWLVEWYPLILAPVFLFYRWLLLQDFSLGNVQILADIHFLTFSYSTSFIYFFCWLIAFLGVAAFLTSISPGLEVRASGGLGERFALGGAERQRFFERFAGNLEQSEPVAAPLPPPTIEEPKAEVLASTT